MPRQQGQNAKQAESSRLDGSEMRTRRVCLSVDAATTEIIKEMQKRKGTDRVQTVREILRMLVTGEIKTKEVLTFYNDVWIRRAAEPEQNVIARYSWSDDADTALHLLSTKILGAKNRSESFRVLIAFVGMKSGLVRIKRIQAADLEIVASR